VEQYVTDTSLNFFPKIRNLVPYIHCNTKDSAVQSLYLTISLMPTFHDIFSNWTLDSSPC